MFRGLLPSGACVFKFFFWKRVHLKWVVVVRGRMLMRFKEKRDGGASLSLQPYQFMETMNRHECMNQMGGNQELENRTESSFGVHHYKDAAPGVEGGG